MGSFICIGYYSPKHGTDVLKVSSERLGNEDKVPCQRVLLRGRDLNRGHLVIVKSKAITE